MYVRGVTGLLLMAIIASAASAADTIAFLDSKKPPIRGTISSTTKDSITIQERGEIVTVPVTEVRAVIFDGEPNELRDAREALRQQGDVARALSGLSGLDLKSIERAELRAEVQFFALLARARLAMGGKEKTEVVRGQLEKFLKDFPTTYHFYEATETVGDLWRADGKHAEAIASFTKLAASATYKQRANLAIGWTQLEQNQPPAALKAFDAALAAAGTGAAAEETRRMATLGRAACFGKAGKTDEALKMVNDVIAKADPEERAVHARAYNVMGGIHAQAATGKDKDKHAKAAVLAYLRVDILYPHDPMEHAEALGQLAALWGQVGQPQRATDARTRLAAQYPSSRWAGR